MKLKIYRENEALIFIKFRMFFIWKKTASRVSNRGIQQTSATRPIAYWRLGLQDSSAVTFQIRFVGLLKFTCVWTSIIYPTSGRTVAMFRTQADDTHRPARQDIAVATPALGPVRVALHNAGYRRCVGETVALWRSNLAIECAWQAHDH